MVDLESDTVLGVWINGHRQGALDEDEGSADSTPSPV